jgi:competence protein ComFC
MAGKLVKLLFPQKCIFCGKIIDYESDIEICKTCYKKIPFVDRINYELGFTRYYDNLICLCKYSGIIKECLIKFKFYEKVACYRVLSKLMAEKIKKVSNSKNYDMIMSVPLHRKKRKLRGYNQSLLVSRSISKRTGIPEQSLYLKKVRETESQSLLTREKRYLNVKAAFKISRPKEIKGRSVLIVDDIFTTGSTINECARVLKEAGASRVTALVIASGRV